ncbi:MAG: retropepsin-like aspartic protease [Bacteroidetes bacterium]|nr:retropepsin-like aspartic protease [Bacteroidota bacterium]
MRFFFRVIGTALFLLFSSGNSHSERIPLIAGPEMNHTIYIPGLRMGNAGPAGEPESVIIPLKRIGRLFMIEAKVDNLVGNFLFDTGSSQLVLNSTYFRKYILMSGVEGGGITGSTGELSRTRVGRLDISGFSYTNLLADVTSLGHIENRRGVKILGLFGASMLKGLEVVIDINHNELRLYRLDKSGNRLSVQKNDFKADVTEKVFICRNVLFVKVKIGGKFLDFCLDTGAESNVISCYASKKVLSTVTILRRSDLLGVGSGESEVFLGKLNDFSLGEHAITNMQTIVTSLGTLSSIYDYPIDGMLGYDFFEQGEISINLVKSEISISFNKTGKS